MVPLELLEQRKAGCLGRIGAALPTRDQRRQTRERGLLLFVERRDLTHHVVRAAAHDALFSAFEEVAALAVTFAGEHAHAPVFASAMSEEGGEFGLGDVCHKEPF